MYLVKHTDKNPFGKSFFKILLILLPVIVIVFIFGSPLRSILGDAISPLFKTGHFFYDNLGRIPKFFSDRNSLINENTRLLDEAETLRIDIADYESIKYENQKLRQDLGIKPAGNFISASIIARSPQIPTDSLFLDKGFSDGIKNGDIVLAGERVLIGKIVEVSGSRATAALNSFANSTSYGFVGRTSEPIEIKGAGGGNIQAKVPIDFDIVVGDKIMVASSSDYTAAIVGAVEEDQSSGFKNVLMSLPADVSKLDVVFIEPTN